MSANKSVTVQIMPGVSSKMEGQPPSPPSVDTPVLFVTSGTDVSWECKQCGPDEQWVVMIQGKSPFLKGQKVFTPKNPTGRISKVRSVALVKYTLATKWGVLDPHIIPIPGTP
jgi:hypothetical protein